MGASKEVILQNYVDADDWEAVDSSEERVGDTPTKSYGINPESLITQAKRSR